MQKDEHDLFPAFVKYYGEAFGYNHIHVLDNGSSPTMDAALEHAKSLGVSVKTDHNTPQDFEQKGVILGKEINANQDNYDVFLPLDCDEFIGLKEADGSYTCDVNNLLNFFSSLEPGAYRTIQRVRNNLTDLERFFIYGGSAKVFFVKTAVVGLDVGSHGCKSPKKITDTALCHFELHNKPFEILQQHARNKMELRVDVDDMEALKQYTGKGIHLIRFLRKNAETAYISSMQKQKWFHTEALKQAFSKLKLCHPFVGTEISTLKIQGENTVKNVVKKPTKASVKKPAIEQFSLAFPGEVANFVRDAYHDTKGVFEYGSGGSTLVAAKLGKPFISIETDEKWTKSITEKVAGIDGRHRHSSVLWVDIGKTKEWGFPADSKKYSNYWKYPLAAWMQDVDFTPDTVLIDGRMRKACFCAALAMTKKPIRILFDDYAERKFYHEVECLVKPALLVGRMAVFDIKPGLVTIDDLPKFLPWFSEIW